MASVRNPWVGYLDRSYEQIKSSLLSKVTLSNPELTDHSESNIFVIIISMFSAVAEMLNYYIDNIAEESFLSTAQRRSSVIKHSRALDYRIKARNPESVDLKITWTNPIGAAFTLQAGFTIASVEGIVYTLLNDFNVLIGSVSSFVPIAQISNVNQVNVATTTGVARQKVSLGTTYLHKTSGVIINSLAYTEVDTFAFSNSTSRHYIVELEEDGNAYIVIGDGVKGFLPAPGLNISITFRTTLGPDGKVGIGKFDKNTITITGALPIGVTIFDANSLLSTSGGTYYEDTNSIRYNSITGIRTLSRGVTRLDFTDLLNAFPGIAKSALKFSCGKFIELYIVPSGGGIASSLLISDAQNYMEELKMITTFPIVKPSGQTELVISAEVTARKRKTTLEVKQQVEEALLEFGLIENQSINGAVRLSDLQALIDNLSSVDYVEITGLYTKPYASPLINSVQLVWTNQTKNTSNIVSKWKIDYDGSFYRIFRDGAFKANLPGNTTYVAEDNSFTFLITDSAYPVGSVWEFYTYPYLKNIQLVDYSILSTKSENLAITVILPTADSN